MCIDGSNQVERSISAQYRDDGIFPDQAYRSFDLTDSSWDRAGKDNPFDGRLPVGKMLAAILVLGSGLRGVFQGHFHSGDDYFEAASSNENSYHGSFEYRLVDGKGEATGHWGVLLATDYTEMHCAVFNFGKSRSDDPVNRASVLLHEGWHHWQYANDRPTGHLTGGRIVPGLEGDMFLLHSALGSDQYGQLAHIEHSPYQIQVEFDADIAEHGTWWVPMSARLSARYYGNVRITKQFYNFVPMYISDPRPFWLRSVPQNALHIHP
jgi:hypothetical protein